MTIRSKLALGLLTIALILVIPLVLALQSLEQLHSVTRGLRDREFTASLLVSRIRGVTEDARQREGALLFVPDSTRLPAAMAVVTQLGAMVDSLRNVDTLLVPASVEAGVQRLAELAPQEYQAAVRGDTARADSISRHHFLRTLDDVDAMLRRAEVGLNGRTSVAVAEATDRTSEARNAAAIGLVVAVTVTIVVSLLLWRLISRPVRDLETGMAAVADGNFGYRLPVSTERRDEFGRLAVSFQSMTRQLAQLDRLKAEFISIASHELKTPINVVLGYIQLMCEGVYGPVSAKQEEVLRTIDAQARSLSRLVHQLLDISRFEAGGGKLDLRATDLAAFLDELEGTFEVLGMQRGVDFRVERSGTLAREVTWDADRVNEVLGNLLSNAFKFTGRGGTVELLVEGTEHEVHLTVRDTGAGIPPEQLPRIFEKFYQADNQGSAAHGGTGLGLAIAKQIVQAHGGEIGVESTLGIGTTFHILLPVRAGGRLRRRAMTPSSPAGAPA